MGDSSNSEAIAVANPATIARTPKKTINTGTKKLREAHKRSVTAGSYSGEFLLQAAFASRNSSPLDLIYISGGKMYPIACPRMMERSAESGRTAESKVSRVVDGTRKQR